MHPRLGHGSFAAVASLLLLVSVALAGCTRDAPGHARADEPVTARIEGPDAVAVGDTVTLLGRAEGIPDGTAFWFWDFGDGTSHEAVALDLTEHEYAAAGAFTVTLTVVDAEGRRGTATHELSVSQEFAFEGTVAAPTVLGLGGSTWSSAVPAGANATALVIEASFRDAGVLPGLAAEAPRVIVRVIAPENRNATAGRDGAPLILEVALDVDADGERLRAVIAGDRFHSPADLVLEVVPLRGSTHFEATLRVTY